MPVLSLLAAIVMSTQQGLPATVIPAQDLAPMKANSYDWWGRHDAVVKRVKQGHVDLILVGDSITHGLGGSPDPNGYGGPGGVYDKYFGGRNTVNLGFGWDRTQHVLWRFDHSEIDGISPKAAVVMIGTNNIGVDKTDDIVLGITAIVDELQQKLPKTKILLLAVFPRGHEPTDPARIQVAEVNAKLASGLAKRRGVTYMDIGSQFLQPDGTISRDIMGDYLHPTGNGYEIWMKAMEPTLAKLMGEPAR